MLFWMYKAEVKIYVNCTVIRLLSPVFVQSHILFIQNNILERLLEQKVIHDNS